MKNGFRVPLNKAWLAGIVAVPVSFFALFARWSYQEEAGAQVSHPTWDMIAVDYLTLFANWQFYVAAVVFAALFALAPVRWNALIKSRSRALWPWAVFAPVWHSLWVSLCVAVNNGNVDPSMEALSAWPLGGAVGGLIGLLIARMVVVRPMRLLGNYGFYSRYLKFRFSKGDDKVVLRVRGKKIKKIELDLADFDFSFEDETHLRTVSYNTGQLGTVYGSGGVSRVYIPGESKSYNETVYTGYKKVDFPGRPYGVEVLLTYTESNELLQIMFAMKDGAIAEAKARKQTRLDAADAAKKDQVLARWTADKDRIYARAGLTATADPFFQSRWNTDTGEITFLIFTTAAGQGGYVSLQNNQREEWYGNWNTSRIINSEKAGCFLIEVSDPAYEKAHMAKRMLTVTGLNEQTAQVWRSRIEMIAKNSSSPLPRG